MVHGSPPPQSSWDTVTYKYDPSGRRIEKDVDGDKTTYVYDGGNVIAEYDDIGSLAKKYIHGARVDELVCMIDVADSSAVYYYHYDGLGSVVALSNSSGNSCQSYVYSAYGRVWAEYPEFKANPYMFTGRRFDYETGLYYYRARYYNPYIGRFLQTDPVGYSAGMNLYTYCRNNPLGLTDPSGCDPFDLIEGAVGLVSDVAEVAVGVVSGVGEVAANAVFATAQLAGNAVQQILDDIASHQEVAFYVIGQDGIRLPVKVFESRSRTSGIPFLAGVAINIGGEIHIGPEMAADLIRQQNIRDSQGLDLEWVDWPIMEEGYEIFEPHGTPSETTMAHEIGHQVDADKLGPVVYQLAGLIFTHDQDGWFEENANYRGEYYGIDWNYNP